MGKKNLWSFELRNFHFYLFLFRLLCFPLSFIVNSVSSNTDIILMKYHYTPSNFLFYFFTPDLGYAFAYAINEDKGNSCLDVLINLFTHRLLICGVLKF